MHFLFLICVIAAASAAPHYGHYHHDHGELQDSSEEFHRPSFEHHPRPPYPGFGEFHGPSFEHHPRPPYPGFGESVFDTRTFWSQLANEMKQMDEILKNFYEHFPSSVSSEGVDGDQYKIIIPLSGYKEEEISVKARTGVLMIQAIQKTHEGNQRSYLDVRTLPECIDLSGTWSYDKDILNIQFPLKKNDSADNPVTELTETEFPTTEAANHSREEMGNDNNDNLDVDIGNRGDNDQNREVETNEIPDKQTVEATTYAVDLKNEVEFVPVNY